MHLNLKGEDDMRRIVTASLVIAVMALAFVPAAPAAPAAKVAICHVSAANGVLPFGPVLVHFGRTQSVSGNSLAAHLAHGDGDANSLGAQPIAPATRAALEAAGFPLQPNADCQFNTVS